jgi:sirohydrochlorin ferrochelatase
MGIYGDVLTAFLDDDPEIGTIYARTALENIIAIPLFLAMGSHTTIDVPEALGLPPDETHATIQGKKLIYTSAIGADNDLTDIIIDLAHEAGGHSMPKIRHKAHGDFFRVRGGRRCKRPSPKMAWCKLGNCW